MLKVALIGCGSMGKNHARVLMNMEGADLVAIVEESLKHIPTQFSGRVFNNTQAMLDEVEIDYAVIAAPTVAHHNIALMLIESGIPFLVEKPVASTVAEAQELVTKSSVSSVLGGVGHIERYNAAVQEASKRIEEGQLGAIIQIMTQRTGPFPGRISDVGVAKDLATHDIDAARFLAGSEYENFGAYTARKSGREHEDLIACSGQLENGVVVNHVVNWLSPVKRRSMVVLGERGAFEIDTLNSQLTFFENGQVDNSWDAVAMFRGVSEGHVTSYAFPKKEPLLAEHEAFRDAVQGKSLAIVTLKEGLKTLEVAETIASKT